MQPKKQKTVAQLEAEHRYYSNKKLELYKRGSLRGIAGINQNLDLLRWQIEEAKKKESEATGVAL